MGALTSKPYVYKARPWDLKSFITIAINDPMLPLIKVDVTQRKIIRILPVIGPEEWINDTTRFFRSTKVIKSTLAKEILDTSIEIDNLNVHDFYINHNKISVKEAMVHLSVEILKKRSLTLILGAQSDIKLIESIRAMDNLREYLNITSTFVSAKRNYINENYELEFDDRESLCLLLDITKASPILATKISNFTKHGGELYQFINAGSTLGGMKTSLFSFIEGFIFFLTTPFFIVNTTYNSLLPAFFKRFVLDANPLSLSLPHKNNIIFPIPRNNYINLNANLLVHPKITNLYTFSSDFNNHTHNEKFIIPTASIWHEVRLYSDLFGGLKKTSCVHPQKSIPTTTNVISLLLWLLSEYLF